MALEYAKRLADEAGMSGAVVPVRRKAHQQPVYHLIFLTHGPQGLWVFGDAASIAREKWIEAIGPDDPELERMKFDPMEDQIPYERAEAVALITSNLRDLVADGGDKRVLDHQLSIMGAAYGMARETDFNQALRDLVDGEEISYVVKAKKPYDHIIRRAWAG